MGPGPRSTPSKAVQIPSRALLSGPPFPAGHAEEPPQQYEDKPYGSGNLTAFGALSSLCLVSCLLAYLSHLEHMKDPSLVKNIKSALMCLHILGMMWLANNAIRNTRTWQETAAMNVVVLHGIGCPLFLWEASICLPMNRGHPWMEATIVSGHFLKFDVMPIRGMLAQNFLFLSISLANCYFSYYSPSSAFWSLEAVIQFLPYALLNYFLGLGSTCLMCLARNRHQPSSVLNYRVLHMLEEKLLNAVPEETAEAVLSSLCAMYVMSVFVLICANYADKTFPLPYPTTVSLMIMLALFWGSSDTQHQKNLAAAQAQAYCTVRNLLHGVVPSHVARRMEQVESERSMKSKKQPKGRRPLLDEAFTSSNSSSGTCTRTFTRSSVRREGELSPRSSLVRRNSTGYLHSRLNRLTELLSSGLSLPGADPRSSNSTPLLNPNSDALVAVKRVLNSPFRAVGRCHPLEQDEKQQQEQQQQQHARQLVELKDHHQQQRDDMEQQQHSIRCHFPPLLTNLGTAEGFEDPRSESGDMDSDSCLQHYASCSERHDSVTVLFSDICNFTSLSEELKPSQVMALLGGLYCRFDKVATELHVFTVDTIGDSYMCAANLIHPLPNHAEVMVEFAKRILQVATTTITPLGTPLNIRIGIHTGPVMSGVLGEHRMKFTLVGDTVNTASRMESSAMPNSIQVSSHTHDLLQGKDLAPLTRHSFDSLRTAGSSPGSRATSSSPLMRARPNTGAEGLGGGGSPASQQLVTGDRGQGRSTRSQSRTMAQSLDGSFGVFLAPIKRAGEAIYRRGSSNVRSSGGKWLAGKIMSVSKRTSSGRFLEDGGGRWISGADKLTGEFVSDRMANKESAEGGDTTMRTATAAESAVHIHAACVNAAASMGGSGKASARASLNSPLSASITADKGPWNSSCSDQSPRTTQFGLRSSARSSGPPRRRASSQEGRKRRGSNFFVGQQGSDVTPSPGMADNLCALLDQASWKPRDLVIKGKGCMRVYYLSAS